MQFFIVEKVRQVERHDLDWLAAIANQGIGADVKGDRLPRIVADEYAQNGVPPEMKKAALWRLAEILGDSLSGIFSVSYG